MAVETVSRWYMYGRKTPANELKAFLAAFLAVKYGHPPPEPLRVTRTPFFHNDLHDLESLWDLGAPI